MVGTSDEVLLSRRVEDDEADLLMLIDELLSLTRKAVWAVDQPGGGAALVLALQWGRGQEMAHVPGLAVDRARGGYRASAGPTTATSAATPASSPTRPE